MQQLRTPDLFRFRQNYLTHKQKIKTIMNRSTQSIRSLSKSQSKLLNKNQQSHQKAFKFRNIQKQRQLIIVNNNFVTRIYENDIRRTKLFAKQINTSRSYIHLAKQNFLMAASKSSTSRIKEIKKDNSMISKKLNQVRSTISCKDFHKEYEKHAERSSSMSRFKIDARSFKFIPKNEILLQRIDRVKSHLSISKSKLLSSKLSQQKTRTQKFGQKLPQNRISIGQKLIRNSSLMRLSLGNNSSQQLKKIQFKNIKLQKLNINNKKSNDKILKSSLKSIQNPQRDLVLRNRKFKLNNF